MRHVLTASILAVSITAAAYGYAHTKGTPTLVDAAQVLAEVREPKNLADIKNALEKLYIAANKAQGRDKVILISAAELLYHSSHTILDACKDAIPKEE